VENKAIEDLEKKINILEERLNNYSFLINLSQVLKIDKTIVKEVETYKSKAILYDRLLSGAQREIVVLNQHLKELEDIRKFTEDLMKLINVWSQTEANINIKSDMQQMYKIYYQTYGIDGIKIR
jgi:16S rRNA G527 N7-methylase RsmG